MVVGINNVDLTRQRLKKEFQDNNITLAKGALININESLPSKKQVSKNGYGIPTIFDDADEASIGCFIIRDNLHE